MFGNFDNEYLDNAKDKSRQLDYYNIKGVIYAYDTKAEKPKSWWLRSACSMNGFNLLWADGTWNCGTSWYIDIGISPAFRIG